MEEISLREIIEIIYKGKKIIAIAVIVCLLIGLGGTLGINMLGGTAKIVLAMHFSGIEKGLNPDGTKFDPSLIKSPAVVQKALDSLGIDAGTVPVSEVRNRISVEPIVPKDVATQAENAVKAGKDFIYFPNQYIVTYDLSNPFKLDKSAQIKLLDAVISSYESFFNDTYSDKTILGNLISQINYDEYDYPEISTAIDNQIKMIVNYLQNKSREAGDFRSKTTGLAFSDIVASLNVLQRIDVQKMDSLIGAYNLTKDRPKLITKYEHAIKINELARAKKEDEARIANEMMTDFQQERNMVLIPGLTGGMDNTLETQQNNSYYDELARRSTDAGVEATNNIHDNEYLRSQIERLQNDTVAQELKDQAVKDVMSIADSVKVRLDTWVKSANDTLADYYNYKYNKAITRLSAVGTEERADLKMNLAIALVIGLMIGLFIVLAREYWRKSEPKEIVVSE